MRRRLLRLLVLATVCFGAIALTSQPAAAHNSLAGSDPADGQTLAAALGQMVMDFAKSVPLETMSAEIVDAAGVRSALTGLKHGAADTQVVVLLPTLAPGTATVRWRLVGADGHQITGRVAFTLSRSATSTASATSVAPTSAAAVAAPASTASVTTIEAPGSAEPAEVGLEFSEPYATPALVRWLLRMLAYVAIMVVCAVAATAGFVWQGVWDEPVVQIVVRYALGTGVVTAVAQLLVTASDISGDPPWSSTGRLGGALQTDAGKALAIRVVVLALIVVALYMVRELSDSDRWTVVSSLALLALATWAFAGHSKSMRWALMGVPLDVIHHAAAAAWLGGLGIVGIVAYRVLDTADFARAVDKFGQLAATAVAAIVITGVLQTFRLIGNPFRILSVRHGQLLVLKLVVIAIMLKVADINRKRVALRFKTAERSSPKAADMLRRAMGTELGIGALAIAVTAAMVVSPPATAQTESATPPTNTIASSAVSPTATQAPTPTSARPATTPAPATPCAIASALRLGATGPNVTCLQNALIAGGWLKSGATGTFDTPTDTAVRAAQTANGLTVDGIVGPQTGRALRIWPVT